MSGIKIGEVARRSGLTVEAIRYYEQRGLLPEPGRSAAGYRLYAPAVVERLAFIGRAKKLGFSLQEVGELLDLQLQPGADRGAVKGLVEEKLALVRSKIAELQQLDAVLGRLSESCDGQGSLEACPIIHFLQDGCCGSHSNDR